MLMQTNFLLINFFILFIITYSIKQSNNDQFNKLYLQINNMTEFYKKRLLNETLMCDEFDTPNWFKK